MPAENRPSPGSGGAARRPLALLGQFVLIPLVIVLIGVSVFLLFGLVASEPDRPRDALAEIRSGSASRRWQAAWELSRMLRQPGRPADPALVPEIISTLEWAANEDPKVRRYLARTLGYLGDRRAVPALVSALEDPDTDTRLWAAEALGAIGDPAARAPLASLLSSRDRDLRKQAAHSLGSLGNPQARGDLQPLLQDEAVDVRWNAALALARLGDAAGAPVLLAMLDREGLEQVPDIRPEQQEVAMVSALAALAALRHQESVDTIRSLSRNDPSLRVRQAALQALERMEAAPPPS